MKLTPSVRIIVKTVKGFTMKIYPCSSIDDANEKFWRKYRACRFRGCSFVRGDGYEIVLTYGVKRIILQLCV